MQWNRSGRQRAASHDNRTYVPFDPEYTLSSVVLCKIFGWSRATLNNRVKTAGFPAPKHFGQKHVRWHPQEVNDWIKSGGGS